MAAKIAVPGTFSFDGPEVKFLFEGGGREIDLSALVHYEPGRQVLLAILGVGIQDLTGSLQKPDVPPPESVMGADSLKESEQQMEEVLNKAQDFLKQAQDNVESLSKG